MLAFLLAPFYLLFNLYLFRRIMGWVRAWFPWFRKRKHWAVSAALYAFFALSFVLAFPLPAGRPKRALMLIGNYWLGVLLYLLLAVLLADGLRLLLVHGLKLRSLRSARMHRIAGCLCAAAILVTSVGGVINARIVRVTPYEVTVNKSAGSMESMKVVLLADLHLGYNVGLAQMERMVARVNEQDADAVVIAGDIFDNAWEAVEEPEQIAAVLRGIRSRYGVYAVYGNHDIEEPILAGFTFRSDGKKQSSPEMDAFLASANIRLLRDEAVLLGGEVYLYGRPDAQRPGRGVEVRKTPAELVEGLDTDKPILVLDHQPRELEELAAAQPQPQPEPPAAGEEAEESPEEGENSQAALIMAHVRRYLEDNYMFDLSLDSVGEILHISPAYLSAQFKKYQKMNFLDCLTELRINAAKELLADPFRSSAEVASMVGYEDASYFARAFKKRTGMTPTQYRKEAAKSAREARL